MRVLSILVILALVSAWVSPLVAQGKPNDDLIHDAVLRKLANDTTVKGGGIDVEVKQGVVTLTGKVKTEKQKTRAESLARRVKGVTEVINKLVVDK